MISIENSKKNYLQLHPNNNNPELPEKVLESIASNKAKITEINNKISKEIFYNYNKKYSNFFLLVDDQAEKLKEIPKNHDDLLSKYSISSSEHSQFIQSVPEVQKL